MGIASNVQHATWILPIIAGVAWLVMMLAMLGVWRARVNAGDAPYASQFDSRIAYVFFILSTTYENSPSLSYISDIGAYGLHWLFILGCFITAITYFTTVIMINYPIIAAKREYERRIIKVLAAVTIIGGLVSSVALIALSFTSIATERNLHLVWLFLFILGMLFTGLVMAGVRSRKPRPEGYRQLYAEHRKLYADLWYGSHRYSLTNTAVSSSVGSLSLWRSVSQSQWRSLQH